MPEGSETFQKALEDLYSSEPSNAPSNYEIGYCVTGLTDIIEGNESDFVESEEELKLHSDEDNDVKISRRHSSPSFPQRGDLQVDRPFRSDMKGKKSRESQIKRQDKQRKDYSAKPGNMSENSSDSKAVSGKHNRSAPESQNRD